MKIRSTLPLLTGLLFALLSLTSCGDIQQDLMLNADGSGTLETSIDMGEMMSMINGFSDISPEDVTVSEDTEIKEVEPAEEPSSGDPMEELMDRITDPEYPKEFDTLFSFVSIMPDSVKEKQERMDLMERMSMRIKSPANSADLTMGIIMKFDNAKQLNEMIQHLNTMDTGSSSIMGNAGPNPIQTESFLSFEADMEKGWIRFDEADWSKMSNEFGMSSDSLMSGEDMGMMEMMFGGSKIRTIVHVPGDVKSCTNKDAILTKDDKVIIEYSFMDVLKKKKIDGYTIHFKPRK